MYQPPPEPPVYKPPTPKKMNIEEQPREAEREFNQIIDTQNTFEESRPSESNERQISGIEVFEGFRPPYADEDIRTGFSGIVVKK